MATRRITLPRAMRHQVPVLTAPARFKCCANGRRWGKTALGLLATVKGHGPHSEALIGAARGGTIGWVAPNYTITDTVIWPDLKRACQDAAVRISEKEHKIELPGGGSVKVMSADDPNNLRGPGWDGLVLDEAAFIDHEAWREVLRPALSDRQGWAIFISTPDGMNWFYDLFEQAGDSDGWARWQCPTSDNPLIPPEELESARREIGDRAYAQEYLAQFMSTAGALFPADWFGQSCLFDLWPTADRVKATVIAFDPSMGQRETSDYQSFVVLVLDVDGIIHCEGHLMRKPIPEVVRFGVELYEQWRPLRMAVESNGFQGLLTNLFHIEASTRSTLMSVHQTHSRESKTPRVRRLEPFLQNGRIRFKRNSPGTALLLQQLREFPVGPHDDGPDALEIGVRCLIDLQQPAGKQGGRR